MVLKLDTNTREIKRCYEEFEQNLTTEQKEQLKLDTASMVVYAMVRNAESNYTVKEVQKLYIDVLAAYAKRLIDPDGESDNIDVSARIREMHESKNAEM